MITAILFSIGALGTIYYLIGLYNELYWKKRGVKFYAKNRVFGPAGVFMMSNRPMFDIFDEIYNMYPEEPAIGVGSLVTPALFVKDPSNVQHVLQLDFNSFNHRGFDINEGDNLADNILFMNGNRWKLMRQSMTPLFSSSKIKNMFYIMDRSAQDFVAYLNERPEKLKDNVFNTLSTFCCAAISAAVFGIGTESIFDSPFLDMAHDAMKSTFKSNLNFAIASLNSTLFKFLKIKLFKDHEKFFVTAVKQIINQRSVENVKKHDFGDICMTLKNNGAMIDKDTGTEIQPTDELLAAQAFFFFVAGVEPSATAMYSLLVELGRNPEVLEKVHEEIDSTFQKHNNKITYDNLSGLEYLDMAYNESMRMYPPIGFLTRGCVRDTVLPVGNIKVNAGTRIFTPIFAIHHDSKFFPEPEVFKPERFSPENRSRISDFYMPFGKGGRLCIGNRFATLQVKAGLVHLLRHFTVKTHIHEGGIKYSKQQMQVRASNLTIELIPRNIMQK
ncbi:cytochrome P450 6B5-like [Battus philenor]|uniref:cytochrome P450 6B5-like n=1 Tax=Battus philenor TaxID=42288 RepID=UPI0035CFA520